MLLQHTGFVHQRELKRPVFHTNLAEQRSERLLDKVSATLMQTAEVTISKISQKKTARSPSTVTACLKTQVVEDNVHGVIFQASNVLLMVVHHDIRTEILHEINANSRYAVSKFPRRELWPVGFPEPVLTWPAVTTTGGFEDQERPFPVDSATRSLQRWGSRESSQRQWERFERRQTAGRQGTLGVHTCGTLEQLDRSVDLNDPLRIQS